MSTPGSWFRFAGRTLATAAGRPGRPTKMVFVVTKRCHSRCTYCSIWKAKDTPGALDNELTLEEIRRVAAANPYLQWIDFTGGEPTDRPDLPEIVEAFAQSCPDLLLVHFPTNGLATERLRDMTARIHRTVRARLVVTVSVDGPPELNDRLRGVPRDFAHAVASYAALRAILGAPNVFIGMTLHAHSGSCGTPVAQLVDATFAAVNTELARRCEPALDWAGFHANIPHLSSHYYGNTACANQDGFGSEQHRHEIAAALDHLSRQPKHQGALVARAIERIYRHEAHGYLQGRRPTIPCRALLSTLHLAADGEVYPCTTWDKPLGNVRDHGYDLLPLVEGARSAGVTRQIAAGKCPNCWTPCEAFPAILAAPVQSGLRLFAKG